MQYSQKDSRNPQTQRNVANAQTNVSGIILCIGYISYIIWQILNSSKRWKNPQDLIYFSFQVIK